MSMLIDGYLVEQRSQTQKVMREVKVRDRVRVRVLVESSILEYDHDLFYRLLYCPICVLQVKV